MMRFLSLLLLGLCPCVVSVVVFGVSVRLSWYPMWMRWGGGGGGGGGLL